MKILLDIHFEDCLDDIEPIVEDVECAIHQRLKGYCNITRGCFVVDEVQVISNPPKKIMPIRKCDTCSLNNKDDCDETIKLGIYAISKWLSENNPLDGNGIPVSPKTSCPCWEKKNE